MKKKIVTVYWRDIHTVQVIGLSWQSKDESIENSKKYYDLELITTGILIEKNKDFIVISSTYCPENLGSEEQYADISMIPIVNIIKII